MSQACCLCQLQKGEVYSPNTTIIVEALQQVIKSLVRKESHDQQLLQDKENQITLCKGEIDELADDNNRLKEEIKNLHTSLKSAQDRSDLYKDKFSSAQGALVELHDKNKELANKHKKTLGQTSRKPFPFRIVEAAKKRPGVVLAPDTCQPQDHEWSSGADHAEDPHDDLFAKPVAPATSTNAKSMTKIRHCTVDLVDCSIDPDETCLQGHLLMDARDDADEEEEEDFSIPPSPVLSGSVLSTKRPTNITEKQPRTVTEPSVSFSRFKGTDKTDWDRSDTDSPSLLKMRTALDKQSQQRDFEADKDQSACDEFQDSLLDFREPAKKDSLLIRQKQLKKTISPIKRSSDHDLAGHTSIDELFEKTDGELKSYIDDDITKLDDLDETNIGHTNVQTDNEQNESIVISDDDEGMSDLDDFDVSTSGLPPKKKKCSAASISKQTSNDSFDVVPKKDRGVNYKFQSVIRKRDEREKLEAKSCPQCEAYYSDLPPDERERALKEICRHRHQFAPPSSPEHFWELGIPSTAECRRRGYIKDEEDLSPRERTEAANRKRRKKPLQARFDAKK